MDVATIIQKLRELEALVDDQERATIYMDSLGQGHIEIDQEELADFNSLDELPAALEEALQNMREYVHRWIDDLPTLHQLDEAGWDVEDI